MIETKKKKEKTFAHPYPHPKMYCQPKLCLSLSRCVSLQSMPKRTWHVFASVVL